MHSDLTLLMRLGCLTLVSVTLQAVDLSAEQVGDAGPFAAYGNSDPSRSFGDPGDAGPFPGQVIVRFEAPVHMKFAPPAQPVLVTENGIEYSSGYAETYDPQTGIEASFEVFADFDNRYARMWIIDANPARVTVGWTAALGAHVEGEGFVIAHNDVYSGAPHNEGYGDWVEEVFYVYPDATRTRYARIHSGHAEVSRPFGFDRTPPNVIHEFMEATVWSYGRTPEESLDIKALTLIDRSGRSADMAFSPYPQFPSGFGEFETSNIMRINTRSEWRPFVVGMPDQITIRPYDIETVANPFQSWGEPEAGFATALAHMVNWRHFEQTQAYVSQVYLEGFVSEDRSAEDLARVANSWISPPDVRLTDAAFDVLPYAPIERAFQLVRRADGDLTMEIEATENRPLHNPAFAILNWGVDMPESVIVGDEVLSAGEDVHWGLEDETLIVWMEYEARETAVISIIE